MDKIKISLCICCWNTAHLLKRSIVTYANQDFPKENWELIIIDDNSFDDVYSVIEPYMDKINIRYLRLEHSFGMRGNTVAFNTAFAGTRGEYIAETTAETMFHKNTVRILYETHLNKPHSFVAMKTYNLTPELQLKIDDADWQSDIMNISKLDGWNSPWVQANVANTNFRTHQTCSIKKDLFYLIWKDTRNSDGYCLFMDYGTDDPTYSHTRELANINDITIMEQMVIHQWHLPFQYWQSKGYAPYLNKFAHTMCNIGFDKSGQVPEGGTCEIWDAGSHELLSEAEKLEWSKWDETLKKQGCTIDLSPIHIFDSIIPFDKSTWIL